MAPDLEAQLAFLERLEWEFRNREEEEEPAILGCGCAVGTHDNTSEAMHEAQLFRRLPNCDCGCPKYETAPEPIRFVPPRRSRWAPI